MLTVQQERKIEHELTTLKNELVTREERKRQKELITKKLDDFKLLLIEIKEEERNHKQARLFVIKFQNDKRLKDSETIKKAMRVASRLVLQRSSIEPKIKTTTGRYPESTIIIEKAGRQVLLEAIEGTGVAESVSILTLLSVLNSTQYIKTTLFDEIFSSVSPSNSERISRDLNELVDEAIQMLMIEQKDDIFKHASYREFSVYHDGIKSIVTTYEVDKYGNKTLVDETKVEGDNNGK